MLDYGTETIDCKPVTVLYTATPLPHKNAILLSYKEWRLSCCWLNPRATDGSSCTPLRNKVLDSSNILLAGLICEPWSGVIKFIYRKYLFDLSKKVQYRSHLYFKRIKNQYLFYLFSLTNCSITWFLFSISSFIINSIPSLSLLITRSNISFSSNSLFNLSLSFWNRLISCSL